MLFSKSNSIFLHSSLFSKVLVCVECVVRKRGKIDNLITWHFPAHKYTMMTLEEIGQLLDVARERVRQIEAKALRRLRPPRFGTNEWMNMDPSEKLEPIMRNGERLL